MAGIEMTLAYVLCLASTLLCVVYGLVNWNGRDRVGQESGK